MTYLSLTYFQTVFRNRLVVSHRKISIVFQHPTDPLTPFFIFWFPPFCFWSYFVCIALRQLKFEQKRFFTIAHDFFEKKILRWTLKSVGLYLKKKLFFFSEIRNAQKLVLGGFWRQLNTNLVTKNSYDVELIVYRSVFRKISTLTVDLEIGYMEFFDVRNPKNLMKKKHTMYNWRSEIRFSRIFKIYRFLDVRNTNLLMKNL